jgi:bla regulator protein blaR1
MNAMLRRSIRAILTASTIGLGTMAAQPQARFEVASIKPSVEHRATSMTFNGDMVNMVSFSLIGLMQQAFGVRPTDILNAPAWAKSEPFDVIAKTEAGFGELSMDQLRPVLRNLLLDRFHLATHIETRQLPIYELVVGRDGAKLKPSVGGDQELNARGRIQGVNQDAATLARQLAIFAGRHVVDRTGLPGQFDYTLQWTPDLEPSPEADTSGSSMFTALQEQLGLQLRATRGPVQVVVIDRVDMPSSN